MHTAFICGIAAVVFALLAIAGIFYLLLSLYGTLRFLRRRKSEARAAQASACFAPAVSILKPLRGTDREMYESLRSHCLQEYPQFEIIFGVNDLSDEAVADVERLRREFPDRDIKLIVCGQVLGTNRKVSNLIQMLREARYEYMLINDSDIRAERDYLSRVMAHFATPEVGLVTALYRAEAGHTLASRVEALTISTDFVGGVMSALVVEGELGYAFGSTMAFSKNVLAKSGGLEPLLDYLADDYELGAQIAKAGYKVAIAEPVVETFLPSYGWRAMFEHQMRWARNIRDKRLGGYIGLIVSFGLPWAILAVLFSGGAVWSLALLAIVAGLRFTHAEVLCGSLLSDRHGLRDLWLLPLRDFAGLTVWLASFVGNTVTWRGEVFRLKDGKLSTIARR